MLKIFAAKFEGAAELVRMLFEGDPVAFLILGGAIALTAFIVWLSFYLLRRKGQRLADGIGVCTYTFTPDGLFGERFFLITGEFANVSFSLDSRKTKRKGDHRTLLRFQKPPSVTWAEIHSHLRESLELVSAAQDVQELPDEITLIYIGVGGDPDSIKTFLREVASALNQNESRK